MIPAKHDSLEKVQIATFAKNVLCIQHLVLARAWKRNYGSLLLAAHKFLWFKAVQNNQPH